MTAWRTPSARSRWTRSSRPSPAIPACRWARPTSRPCCSPSSSSSIRPIRNGPTATASCSRPATARCCSTRCCISLGYEAMTIDELKRFRQLGSNTPGHPENFDHAGHRDDHRPARPGPRQRGRHGDRGAASRGRVRRHRRSPHLRARLRRRPDGRHYPGSDRARRPPEAQPADRAVRRQRHLDRRPALALRLGRSGEALRGAPAGPRRASTGTTRKRSRPRSRRRRNPTSRR